MMEDGKARFEEVGREQGRERESTYPVERGEKPGQELKSLNMSLKVHLKVFCVCAHAHMCAFVLGCQMQNLK